MSENLENSDAFYVKDLAKVFSLGMNDIPECLKRNAKNLLEVIDSACVDNPIVIIEWAVNPWPRRGRNRTKTDLINYITTNGGTDEFQLGMIFSFRTSRILGNCMGYMPPWSLHDRNNPNIRDVGHCYIINKVADRSAELEDYNDVIHLQRFVGLRV
ncbi:2615_t:CDS:2 [Rhizophagus irregularis]|nr:2615_t:CDS:2 [Rhizophagus irregularis]